MNRSCIFFSLLVLGACTKSVLPSPSQTSPGCDAAGANIISIFLAAASEEERQTYGAAQEELSARLAAACRDEGWPPRMIDCTIAANDMPALEVCTRGEAAPALAAAAPAAKASASAPLALQGSGMKKGDAITVGRTIKLGEKIGQSQHQDYIEQLGEGPGSCGFWLWHPAETSADEIWIACDGKIEVGPLLTGPEVEEWFGKFEAERERRASGSAGGGGERGGKAPAAGGGVIRCFAQGVYESCHNGLCRDNYVEQFDFSTDEQAASMRAMSNCNLHMTNLTISNNIGGQARIKSTCRVTRCVR